MIKLVKKSLLILIAILLYCYLVILPRPVFAQEALGSPLGPEKINLHTWTQISSLDIVSGLTCQIVGYDPAQPQGKGCVAYDQTGKLVMMEKAGGGAVAFTGNLIAAMYANPPASGVTYLADLGKNLGIVKPAYAAVGTGFSGLSPILPIWKAFRNIAYLFFTIIFIAIGFAIMFRLKISPQAVVSIQSALPRIIITLILVTFSYAIAGFLIDLMYVLILVGVVVLAPAANISNIPELQKIYAEGNFIQIIGEALGIAGAGVPGGIWVAMTGLGGLVGGLIGNLIGGVPGFVVGLVAGLGLFALIIAVIILFVLFKLLIELVKAYISIILLVVFAPLMIMLGAIPGQSGFGNWFRNLLANILVFPAVALFFLLARILTSVDAGKLWVPPMTIGGVSITVASLIGFGMLLIVSKVPEMVKNALQVKPFPYGAAIGEALGPMRAAGGYGVIAGSEYAYQRSQITGSRWTQRPWQQIAEALKTAVQRGVK